MGLVREFLIRPERNGLPQSRQVPVLIFSGSRRSGKTALLKDLARGFDQRIPFAHLDFESIDATSSRQVLAALVLELNRKSGEYGELAFPRFLTGQIVLAQNLDTTDRTSAREKVKQVLEEYRKLDKLREFLTETAQDAASSVPFVEQGTHNQSTALTVGNQVQAGQIYGDVHFHQSIAETPAPRQISAGAPGPVRKGLLFRRWGRRRRGVLGEGQRWYGHQDKALEHDPVNVLVDLNRQAKSPDVQDDQREFQELLWAAFLADLREGFSHGVRAEKRTYNCSVLLDNIDTSLGRDFLIGLTRARRQRAAHAPDAADPLTVVATSRGGFSQRIPTVGESVGTPEAASYEDYRKRSEGQLEPGWYPVELSDLTPDEVSNMVAALGLYSGSTRRIATMVHRFTSGHPGSTRLLLEAIVERGEAPTGLRTILESGEPGELEPSGRTVEECLRDELLADVPADALADVVTSAAARDLDQVHLLAVRGGLLAGARSQESPVFDASLWTRAESGEGRVMHPVLRWLLLRCLIDRPAGHSADWSAVHSWFRDQYAGSGEPAGELYHALALGEVEFVTRRLADLLARLDVHEWLELLRSVTAAPNAFDHILSPVDRVRDQTRWSKPEEPLVASLARLIIARWLAADPLNDKQGLHREIAAEFHEIAPHAGDGITVLREEARKYRSDAA